MHGYELIAECLNDAGASKLFGVAGDANLFMIDALVRNHGIDYVATAHEAAAVLAAIGYARASDSVGFATTTHGPGLTNAFTALVEGVRSHTPMVLIAGDTDPTNVDHPQFIDQAAVVAATGAGFEQLRSLEKAPADIARAAWRAATEERPIVLNMPIQLQLVETDGQPMPSPWPTQQAQAPDPVALDEAVGLIASARRPLVLAGRGARHAHDSIVALAEKLGAPVATTLLANGLFKDHDFNLGIFGTLSNPVASEMIVEADCIIAFGASLNMYTTSAGQLLQGKRLVQCDVAADRVGRFPMADAAVIGDAARVAETITTWLAELDHQPSVQLTSELKTKLQKRAWQNDYVDRGTSETIDPRTLTRRLEEALPKNRTVVVDIGRFMLHALQLSVPEPAALVTTNGFQAIGFGAAAAIGAAHAMPDRPTVLTVGDGGFMMGGLAEFQTAIRTKRDLIVVLYNDGSYGAEHVQLYRKGIEPTVSLFEWPDLAQVAKSMGGEGVTVRSNADLELMEKAIANRSRPLLIDAYLDPDLFSQQMG